MKKNIIGVLFLILGCTSLYAQSPVTSIENRQNELWVNDSISIKKGEQIKIYLPAGKDFVFIKQKKSAFNANLLGKVADVVGTGASAVGMSSGNIKILTGASKIIRSANTVKYGANAIDMIQDLPISNNAKKLAGKTMEVLGWEFTDDGYLLTARLDNRKYEIYLQEAIMAGEVKL